MQTTTRKTDAKTRKEPKEEPAKKDDKLKRGVYTISTPRDFVQKSTAVDIYAQKNKSSAQSVKAPKKAPGITNLTSNVSPMKGSLKSSASSISQISRTEKTPVKASINSARKNEISKRAPTVTSVTVNSPAAKRKLNPNLERISKNTKEVVSVKSEKIKNRETKEVPKHSTEVSKTKDTRKEPIVEVVKGERQRTKTRTLYENEVKILTLDVMDNNAGMMNLSQKLVAQSKAFYVDLDGDKTKVKNEKSSDEEISYEDDFESYESDFESYHSDQTEGNETSEASEKSEKNETDKQSERSEENVKAEDSSLKDGKDEERMLDSGNFELRDRSAKSKSDVMEFILEDGEDRKTVSLTDEGFQDMSSASTMSSMKTLDRPMFLDFTKSKQNKIKRKINERFKQRAKDLLGMITLHEMSYSLFEMKPISYDLYMEIFGRSNYTQSGVQTFDDGITEEIQTEEVSVNHKWTQHPVEFSKNIICESKHYRVLKYSKNTEDYLTKFTFLMNEIDDDQKDLENILDENYKTNPLRIYFEQKDGAGQVEMLPYETYKSKLKNNDYNRKKLSKFLKKCESKVMHVLSSNIGDSDDTTLAKSKSLQFSAGYVSISIKTIKDEKLSYLRSTKISRVIFSETKINLILTCHTTSQNACGNRSVICLWDLSVAREEPVKVLTTIDNISIGRFRGNVDGIFVAALEDGSIHLWDLAEEPTWRDNDTASEKTSVELVEIEAENITELERDREWNSKNSHVGLEKLHLAVALQSCAFTSSGSNMTAKEEIDKIVGLELNTESGNLQSGRWNLGQIISLQCMGILTIWSIIQDKLKSSYDIGKSIESKMKLERYQTIHLSQQIDTTLKQNLNRESVLFNLNAAKRRLSLRKKEKNINKYARPQSGVSSKFDFDFDRPSSVTSLRKRVMPVEIIEPKNWETGMVCTDLKVMRINNNDNYLVSKNCGEVLCCKRCFGVVKTERFAVATDTSSVTNLEVSSKGLPYFLAATDSGTVNLCSLFDKRVLLTLDCRNVPPLDMVDKCQADHKGRFISSLTSRRASTGGERSAMKLDIKSVHWSPTNPCSIYVLLKDGAILVFELTHSDIYAKYMCDKVAIECAANDYNLALLAPDGEVQVHRLSNETQTKDNVNIFEKYVALL